MTAARPGVFRPLEGDWHCSGDITYDTAAAALASARELPLPASGVVRCRDMDTMDSAAVAVLVALMRRAAGEGKVLCLIDAPAPLRALARLYGVDELLWPEAAADAAGSPVEVPPT